MSDKQAKPKKFIYEPGVYFIVSWFCKDASVHSRVCYKDNLFTFRSVADDSLLSDYEPFSKVQSSSLVIRVFVVAEPPPPSPTIDLADFIKAFMEDHPKKTIIKT